MSSSLQPHVLQHTRHPCPSLTPRVCLNSCLLSQWCHPIISSSVTPSSSCSQSFPAWESFPVNQLFASGGQSIRGLSFSISPSNECSVQSVQLLSHVRLFVPWPAACQASLSITNSRSLLKLMTIESVMPSNYLFLCHPLLPLPSTCPSIRVFSGIQGWFISGLTFDQPCPSKGLSGIFSNTMVWIHQFFGTQPSSWSNFHIYTWLVEKPQLWVDRPLLAT